MLSAELKVNGVLVAHLYGHNKGFTDPDGNYVYFWELYEVGKSKVSSGTLTHSRPDGLIVLVQKMLSEHIDLQGGGD